MTDSQIAHALAATMEIEQQARHTWTTTTDLPDKDEAHNVLRHVTVLRRDLEAWIAKRAMRMHLQHT